MAPSGVSQPNQRCKLPAMDVLAVATLLVGLLTVFISVRLLIILAAVRRTRKVPFENVSPTKQVKTMIVAGSGAWLFGDNIRKLASHSLAVAQPRHRHRLSPGAVDVVTDVVVEPDAFLVV